MRFALPAPQRVTDDRDLRHVAERAEAHGGDDGKEGRRPGLGECAAEETGDGAGGAA